MNEKYLKNLKQKYNNQNVERDRTPNVKISHKNLK